MDEVLLKKFMEIYCTKSNEIVQCNVEYVYGDTDCGFYHNPKN